MSHNVIALEYLKHFFHCRAGKGIPAVCSSMVARLQRIFRYFFRHGESSDRNAVSNRLCHGHNIRLHAESLPCEHASSSAHPALNFIADHKDIIFIADHADTFHKLLSREIDSALALQRLQNNRAGLVIYQLFHAVKIIEFREFHSRYQRFERLPVGVMSCH